MPTTSIFVVMTMRWESSLLEGKVKILNKLKLDSDHSFNKQCSLKKSFPGLLFVLSFVMNFAAELFSSVTDCEFTPTITILVIIILNRTFLLCRPKSEEVKIYKQLGIFN